VTTRLRPLAPVEGERSVPWLAQLQCVQEDAELLLYRGRRTGEGPDRVLAAVAVMALISLATILSAGIVNPVVRAYWPELLTSSAVLLGMGVATAKSVMVISLTRQRMDAGDDSLHAALQAGVTRFRPVMMTALAMIIGMVPMAIGIGEGGEQNAPLGRAVIGGLVFATIATLFFVPTVFTLIHGRRSH